MSWGLNVNEGFENGSLFVGNDLEVDGVIQSRSGMEMSTGGDFVMRNSEGAETFRIDGQNGFSPHLDCREYGPSVNGQCTSYTCQDGYIATSKNFV